MATALAPDLALLQRLEELEKKVTRLEIVHSWHIRLRSNPRLSLAAKALLAAIRDEFFPPDLHRHNPNEWLFFDTALFARKIGMEKHAVLRCLNDYLIPAGVAERQERQRVRRPDGTWFNEGTWLRFNMEAMRNPELIDPDAVKDAEGQPIRRAKAPHGGARTSYRCAACGAVEGLQRRTRVELLCTGCGHSSLLEDDKLENLDTGDLVPNSDGPADPWEPLVPAAETNVRYIDMYQRGREPQKEAPESSPSTPAPGLPLNPVHTKTDNAPDLCLEYSIPDKTAQMEGDAWLDGPCACDKCGANCDDDEGAGVTPDPYPGHLLCSHCWQHWIHLGLIPRARQEQQDLFKEGMPCP